MKQDNEHSSNTDPAVSAAYRAIATETAPRRLNEVVLRKAAEESKQKNRLAAYLNPNTVRLEPVVTSDAPGSIEVADSALTVVGDPAAKN